MTISRTLHSDHESARELAPADRRHRPPRPLAALLLLACAADCASAPRSTVDLLVAGDYVVTMNDAGLVIEDGAVAVDGDRIVGVGPRTDIASKFRARRTLDGAGKVVLPGLINGHTHAAMTLLRGIADDIELIEWLQKYIFPTEVRFVDADFVRVGTELACAEMIRGGTTTFVDMYYFPDSVAEAVESCGLRVLVAASVIDQKSPDAANGTESLAKAVDFVRRWKGRSDRIIPIIGAHSVYTIPSDLLRQIAAAADELDVPISIHVSESRFEIETTRKNYQTTPIHLLDDLGVLGVHTIAAHVVWPQDDDLPVLVQRQVGVIHNPSSNMKISSGIAPVTKMLAAGVRVGLGTDGPATNNDLDMWEEMRLAAFLQKVSTMDPKVLPARTALNMATRGGAEAIGLGDEVGTLAPGRRADLIQVSLADVRMVPMYDVISHLVYVAHPQDVTSVVVDGRILMRDGKPLTVDEPRVAREARAFAERIQAALGDTR
jgi:5-methylthioadenosine/S-adenosylhomocysteine deaminase